MMPAFLLACARSLLLFVPIIATADSARVAATPVSLEIISNPELVAPGIVSTEAPEVRLTLSPDGQTAAWFTRNRTGGPGEYDIWISRRDNSGWGATVPASYSGR